MKYSVKIAAIFLVMLFACFVFQSCMRLQRKSFASPGEDCSSDWLYPKKYAIKSEYSRRNTPFEHIYCDDEFDFKEAGVLKGAFMLPRAVYFYGLSFGIYLSPFQPWARHLSRDLYASVRIPVTVVFEWERKDGTRKRVEVKPYIDRNGAIKNYTLNGEISFDYVPFPYERKIEYTLIYDKGEFLEKKDYPLVYKLDKGVIDMTELLETDRTLWKAHFIVGEHHGKGAPDRSRKPAYD